MLPLALATLLIALLAPVSAAARDACHTILRVQGSNTIDATLGPALAAGLLTQQGLKEVRIDNSTIANEQVVSGINAQDEQLCIQLMAHGSSTGFTALQAGDADMAASSRQINPVERNALHAMGDLRSAGAEQVIAIDGIAIIVHPDNPLKTISIDLLGQIFSGRLTRWEQVGTRSGPIHLLARDERSGTWETFKSLVLSEHGETLAAHAQRLESSAQLSAQVSADRFAIGFIGLPYVHNAKALAITDGQAQPMLPTISLIATEDYPLSRRLFFYLPPDTRNPWATALARFAQSPAGQNIVMQNGFVAQTVQAVSIQAIEKMPEPYQQLARHAERLTVNFRFAQGSATLDNKAKVDVQRVLDYLRVHDKLNGYAILVGFGDPKTDTARALLLSRLRAMALRRELAKGGVVLHDVLGMGADLPVANNDQDEGRIKNRRVEVWVY